MAFFVLLLGAGSIIEYWLLGCTLPGGIRDTDRLDLPAPAHRRVPIRAGSIHPVPAARVHSFYFDGPPGFRS